MPWNFYHTEEKLRKKIQLKNFNRTQYSTRSNVCAHCAFFIEMKYFKSTRSLGFGFGLHQCTRLSLRANKIGLIQIIFIRSHCLSAQKQWDRFRICDERIILMFNINNSNSNNNSRHNTTKTQVKAIVCLCVRALGLCGCWICMNIFSPVRYVSFVCFTLESSKDRLYSWHVEMHAKQMCRHKYTYQFYLNESKWSQRIDFHSNAVNSIWVLLSRQTNNSHPNFNHLNFNGFTVQNIGLTSTYVLKLLEQATHASFISPDND